MGCQQNKKERMGLAPSAPFYCIRTTTGCACVGEEERKRRGGKERPPFAKMSTGNANRTEKQKEVSPKWTKKAYHTQNGYVNIT